MKIRLKLYGAFRSAANTTELRILLAGEHPTVKSVISELTKDSQLRARKQLLLDSETSDPRPNALIMVSGREINALNGLDTELKEDDEISLLPVAHGG